MTDAPPTENKVWAATIGSGAGLAISQAVLWLLGVTVWGASGSAPKAADAVAAVPAPIAAFLAVLLTVGLAYAAGWAAKHTPRAVDTSAASQPDASAGQDVYMGSDTTAPAADTSNEYTTEPDPVVDAPAV